MELPSSLSIYISLAAMEERVHPTPFRTRQLSSPSPMILRTSCGKVGRRQSFFKGSVQLKRSEPFSFPLSLPSPCSCRIPVSLFASARVHLSSICLCISPRLRVCRYLFSTLFSVVPQTSITATCFCLPVMHFLQNYFFLFLFKIYSF